tara:strand:- start:66 stop:311 length:246 start_codon:yes stop_codon:yes gene_type:complete
MEAKKLLKKHLDIHIPKGEYRSKKQLIQLRYDASIDAINEALTIHSVVVPKGTLCDDWIHQERVKCNDDKYCPLCGEKLQA